MPSGSVSITPRRKVRSQPSIPLSGNNVGRGINSICSTLKPCRLQPLGVALDRRVVIDPVFAVAMSVSLKHRLQRHQYRGHVAMPAHLGHKTSRPA